MTTPTEELREAAEGCADWVEDMPEFYKAVGEFLAEVADDRHPELPAWVEAAALKIARAYLPTDAEGLSYG